MVNAVRREVVKAKENTTSLIFDCPFACIVPYHTTRTMDELRIRGIHRSGVRSIDQNFHNSRTRVMLSISDMVGKYRDGIAVAICDPDDLPKIYEYVQKHLFAWTDYMDGAGINATPPLDDLIALDQFANSLFRYVKYVPMKTAMQDFFDKYRGKRATFEKDKLFDPEKLRAFLENDPAKVAQRKHEAIYGRSDVEETSQGVTVRGNGTGTQMGTKVEILEREEFSDFFHERRRELAGSHR